MGKSNNYSLTNGTKSKNITLKASKKTIFKIGSPADALAVTNQLFQPIHHLSKCEQRSNVQPVTWSMKSGLVHRDPYLMAYPTKFLLKLGTVVLHRRYFQHHKQSRFGHWLIWLNFFRFACNMGKEQVNQTSSPKWWSPWWWFSCHGIPIRTKPPSTNPNPLIPAFLVEVGKTMFLFK